MDIILGYHVLCFGGMAMLFWLRRVGFGPTAVNVSLGGYLFVWAAFTLLNLTGKVWALFVGEPDSLWGLIKATIL